MEGDKEMRKYLIILAIVIFLAFMYMEFRFDKLESEIIRSTEFISDTLDAMYFD